MKFCIRNDVVTTTRLQDKLTSEACSQCLSLCPAPHSTVHMSVPQLAWVVWQKCRAQDWHRRSASLVGFGFWTMYNSDISHPVAPNTNFSIENSCRGQTVIRLSINSPTTLCLGFRVFGVYFSWNLEGVFWSSFFARNSGFISVRFLILWNSEFKFTVYLMFWKFNDINKGRLQTYPKLIRTHQYRMIFLQQCLALAPLPLAILTIPWQILQRSVASISLDTLNN